MAAPTTAIAKSLVHEGGYAPAFGVSGETYKGIDRKHQPGWAGWRIVDSVKRTKGLRKYDVINNAELDRLVTDFYYKNFWPKSKAGLIKNDVLANNYFDFYFHKPAIAEAALMAAAGKRNIYDAINVANTSPADVYAKFYDFRIAHYKNQWMNGSGKNRIYYSPTGTQKTQLRRAQSYPDSIAGFVAVKN